ncbi:hypothetical protein [uncultured Rhodoblastus sp.]|uniref:hypothetical protein n=1 Tax=uncultured Rhodoblastus sp. TaxID=543037 RepID=UPI0025E298D5|nr:hypothetical protein [uncultured Rhodoblastus sp.]
MSFTRQVYLEVEGEKDLTLLLNYHNGGSEPDSFAIEVFRANEVIGKAQWRVDVEHYAFIFDPAFAVGHPSAAGISKVLGIAVGKGLIESLWASNGDRQEIRKSIKDHAIGVLLDAAGGVAGRV